MIKKVTSYLFLVLLSFSVVAQTNEELSAELDNFIEAEMIQNNIPGVSASIIKDGEIVWQNSYGMANFDTSTQVTSTTKFTLASISKLFTAMACAQLWEQGLLDIDEDINTYLPIEIKNPNFPNTPITTRQLLLHKSSLKDYESDLQLWDAIGDPIYDLDEFCENYFTSEGNLYNANNWKNTSPGNSSYWYSNAGFTLLGYIVEVVSGQPFNVYCKNNIQIPLQMHTSGWFYSEVSTSNIAMPYNTSFTPYGYFSVPEYPAAMLKSDILELSNFLIAITQHGEFNSQNLITPDTFNVMLPNTIQNGFGWWGSDTWYGDSNGNFWSHGGFMNGVRTQLNYYPNTSSGLIILTNGEGSYLDIQNKMEDLMPQFQSSLHIEEFQKDISFQVFPNPTVDTISIKFRTTPNDGVVKLFDSNGKLLVQNYLNTQNNIHNLQLTNISKGVYFLNIIADGFTQTKKIIIQ